MLPKGLGVKNLGEKLGGQIFKIQFKKDCPHQQITQAKGKKIYL
jgi:hypothetical protein